MEWRAHGGGSKPRMYGCAAHASGPARLAQTWGRTTLGRHCGGHDRDSISISDWDDEVGPPAPARRVAAPGIKTGW